MKQSFPYDEIQTKVWQNRPSNPELEELKEWFAYCLVGFFTGFTAFLGYWGVAFLIEHVMALNHKLIHSYAPGTEMYGFWYPALVWISWSCLFGTTAAIMTAWYAQGAAMSGLPEIIAYLNGINYPQFVGMNILLTKMVGNTLAVSAKLCVGKEGPLAHSGANIGVATLYMPGIDFKFLHNDEQRRLFLTAGASCGVACAFGAPIGGPIFMYEHNFS